MNRYAIIKTRVLHSPFISHTSAETLEELFKELGDVARLVPEGPVMIIDFEERTVKRIGLTLEGKIVLGDNADVPYGDLTPWEEFVTEEVAE